MTTQIPNKQPPNKQLNIEASCHQLLNHEPFQAIAIIALDAAGDLFVAHRLHPKTTPPEVDHWKQQLSLYTAIYSKEIR